VKYKNILEALAFQLRAFLALSLKACIETML